MLQPQVAHTSVIHPIEGLEIEARHFTVSATEASKIDLPNGGSIAFPANAFVDQQGKPVKAPVTIAWQEFHSLADILASGIPMGYDSAGVSSQLISGGMFTIDAACNGQEVELARGKEATVSIASNNPQEQFNFYALNEETGKWTYETTAKAEPNPKAGQTPEIELQPLYYVLDIDVAFAADSFPALDRRELIGWEVPVRAISPQELKLLQSKRCDVRIVAALGGDRYRLSLKNEHITHAFDTRAITFDNAPASSKKADKRLEERMKTLTAFQEIAQQGQLIRSISIPAFGTYNWDCMYHNPNAVDAIVKLDIPGTEDEDLASIFLVCPEENRIFNIRSAGHIMLDKTKKACIIAITADKSVYTVNDHQLQEAKKGGREFTFGMNNLHQRITNGDQVGGLLHRCI